MLVCSVSLTSPLPLPGASGFQSASASKQCPHFQTEQVPRSDQSDFLRPLIVTRGLQSSEGYLEFISSGTEVESVTVIVLCTGVRGALSDIFTSAVGRTQRHAILVLANPTVLISRSVPNLPILLAHV